MSNIKFVRNKDGFVETWDAGEFVGIMIDIGMDPLEVDRQVRKTRERIKAEKQEQEKTKD